MFDSYCAIKKYSYSALQLKGAERHAEGIGAAAAKRAETERKREEKRALEAKEAAKAKKAADKAKKASKGKGDDLTSGFA